MSCHVTSCHVMSCHACNRSAGTSDSLKGSLELLESCLGGSTPGSSRLRDSCVHAGPVVAIIITNGRVYTAGGSTASTAALLVWDSSNFELLRSITKRSTRWCR
jgi:hypothetical protein